MKVRNREADERSTFINERRQGQYTSDLFYLMMNVQNGMDFYIIDDETFTSHEKNAKMKTKRKKSIIETYQH